MPKTIRPTLTDNYGLELSCNELSLTHWNRGLTQALSLDNSGIDAFGQALDADPDFALAHAMLGRQQIIQGLSVDGHKSLNNADSKAADLSACQRSQINITLANMRHEPGALDLALEHLYQWPRDILVFSQVAGPFGLMAFSGEPRWQNQCLTLMDQYQRYWPQDSWWYLSTLAFMQAEVGRLSAAETNAEQAWNLSANGNCAHTLSHLHFEQGALDSGLDFIRAWSCEQGRNSDMRHHMFWHQALCELEAGTADKNSLTELYQKILAPEKSSAEPLTTFVDNAALLWRCHIHGIEMPQEVLLQTCRFGDAHFPSSGFVFADLHRAMAALHPDLTEPSDVDKSHTSDLMSSIWSGFALFADGSYPQAADQLQPLLEMTPALGGSNPQRRVVEETWLEACIRAGRNQTALTFLEQRQTCRPSAYDNRLLQALRQRR